VAAAFALNGLADTGWWPEQRAPSGFYTVPLPSGLEKQVIAQAVAGHMARAVNEGSGDALVWLKTGGDTAEDLKNRTVARLGLVDKGEATVEQLLTNLIQQKRVRGYVLYAPDTSTNRPAYEFGAEIDQSLNTACMAAARLRAIPVSEREVPSMVRLGLTCLFDARGVGPTDYFERHRAEFEGRGAIGLLDPKCANNRDLVIAHSLPVTCGTNAAVLRMLEGVRPPAMVLGWGSGDEYRHCLMVSRLGHFHTVSNWILNVPFYSAGSRNYQPRRVAAFDESKVDMSDKRRCVAFMMSDGDNAGFAQGGLWTSRYWKAPAHGSFAMGFSLCAADLAAFSPVTVDLLAATQPPETSLVQFSGGYFYPDHFGESRSNRWDLLRLHAREINRGMERTGVRVMTAIFEKSESAEAKQALKIFAEEMPLLLGVFVMDYAPYNQGKGRLDWIDDARGGKVPALAARYCLWQKMRPPLAGEPGTLPGVINADEATSVGGWVAVHAWSSFELPDGKKLHGMEAVQATVSGLDTNQVHVVSPEELLTRLRKGREAGKD